ncbi:MAG: hypothetical protein WBB45_10070 [Cyclobacteriaceae bacterium]
MPKPRLIFKGKSVVTLALITTVLTVLTVYISGINYNRSVTSNLYLSLGIIALALMAFLTYGLYKGARLRNDAPKPTNYKIGNALQTAELPHMWGSSTGGDLEGLIMYLFMWIFITILLVVVVLFEAIIWLSVFVIFASIYWVLIRALKLVFRRSGRTAGDLTASFLYALFYISLYTG